MPEFTQRAFAAGEIGPAMYGRADMVPYGTGLRTARNFIGRQEGGMMNRPGSQFIRQMAVVGTKSHVFSFNDAQSYHLEFGVKDYTGGGGTNNPNQGYIRFTYRRTTLVLPAGTSTDVPAWAANGTYDARDLVAQGGRHYYAIATHTDVASDKQPGTAGGDVYWYLLPVDPDVTGGSIYEIPTPYADIEDVWFTYPTQSADTMIVTLLRPATVEDTDGAHYAPYQLRRFGHVFWDFVPVTYKPRTASPSGIDVTVPSAGTYRYRYLVTAHEDKKDESLPGHPTASGPGPGTISVNTDGVIQVNSTAHGFGTTPGQHGPIYISDVNSTAVIDPIVQAFLLDQVFNITVVDADNFELNGSEGITVPSGHSIVYHLGYGIGDTTVFPPTAGWEDTGAAPGSATGPSTTAPNVITWSGVDGATHYSIYREETDGSGSYGFLGTSVGLTFNDDGTPPDASESEPVFMPKFLQSQNHPAVCSFSNQRLVFADLVNEPMGLEFSRAGNIFNFTSRLPLQADDAISEVLALKKVNEIRHALDLGEGLLLLTSGSEGLVTGDGDKAITPTTIQYKQQGFRGASRVFPLEIADVILYALGRGNQIYEIHRDEFSGYVQPIDPSIFSSHLFGSACSCAPVAMAWAERPDKVVWVIRSDGMALGMTFLPAQNVRCWTRHDTRGLVQHHFKDVVVVPEGSLDTPYFTVSRTINGEVVEYLEALVPRCSGCSE